MFICFLQHFHVNWERQRGRQRFYHHSMKCLGGFGVSKTKKKKRNHLREKWKKKTNLQTDKIYIVVPLLWFAYVIHEHRTAQSTHKKLGVALAIREFSNVFLFVFIFFFSLWVFLRDFFFPWYFHIHKSLCGSQENMKIFTKCFEMKNLMTQIYHKVRIYVISNLPCEKWLKQRASYHSYALRLIMMEVLTAVFIDVSHRHALCFKFLETRKLSQTFVTIQFRKATTHIPILARRISRRRQCSYT